MNAGIRWAPRFGNRDITIEFSAMNENGGRAGNTFGAIQGGGQKIAINRREENNHLPILEEGATAGDGDGKNVKRRRPLRRRRIGERNTARALRVV